MCEPSCGLLAGVIAQLSLPADQQGGSGEGTNPTMHMEVDWDLGVSGHSDDLPEEDEVCFSGCMQRIPWCIVCSSILELDLVVKHPPSWRSKIGPTQT